MFGKRQQRSATVTIIAQGSIVEGTLRVKGVVQIDGTVEGTLIADGHVSVGPEGSIRGEVIADALSIGGRVEGSLQARGHLHVLSTGAVRGDARYTTLEVDRGGVMDGRASRTNEAGGASPVKSLAPDNDVEMIADEVEAAE